MLLLAGCGGTSATAEDPATTSAPARASADPAAQLRAWADGGGNDTLGTLMKSLGKVDKDSHPVDLTALQSSCAQLTADVEAAAGEDPMPDETLAKRWNLALDHLGKSASACTVGAASEDQASFDLMSAEMSIGNEHLNAVVKRINEITEAS
ncbi:hypothetical protein ABZ341_17065 [Streptomyces sp. NPDC006173]|uniref:hypothetical protein n=1 Tax=Streptomyces sp. NPDC006173 TaxID=3155349 RepID=UPI0034075AC8